MNKQGQAFGMMGTMIVIFVGLIVALALFNGGIFENIGEVTLTKTFDSDLGAGILTNNDGSSVQNLEGKFITNFVAKNASTGATISDNNYTILNNQVVDGALTATINTSSGATQGPIENGASWNVSYTYQPTGYITSGGGRSMATLIAVFAALAIAIAALVPTFRNGLMDLMGK